MKGDYSKRKESGSASDLKRNRVVSQRELLRRLVPTEDWGSETESYDSDGERCTLRESRGENMLLNKE